MGKENEYIYKIISVEDVSEIIAKICDNILKNKSKMSWYSY